MKIIFLDIDGVLNSHKILKAASCCGIDVRCVGHLNHVLRVTGCQMVLSSAWRYMVHGRALTLDGFWYLLRTHGLTNGGRGNPFVGVTIPDERCAHCGQRAKRRCTLNADGYPICRCGHVSTRGDQIAHWLREGLDGRPPAVDRYCVLDDLDLGIVDAGHPFVQTDGRLGLTRGKAQRVIKLLGNGAK